MKIRSKGLYIYLSETGVLNGTPEQIAFAKLAYRKQYKHNWKLKQRPRKELRIEVTLKQYAGIKAAACATNLKPTRYARHVILYAANTNTPVISKDELLAVLQLVSMAYNALQNGAIQNALSCIHNAESKLLHIQNKLI